MDLSEIKDLYDYNSWANARILDTAEKVSPEQFTEHAPHGHGSLRGTLVHTLDAETEWRTRLTDGHGSPAIEEEDFPDAAALRARWLIEEKAMYAYLASLREGDLNKTIHYSAGENDISRVVWHIIVHLINHGTQHRSESAAILTAYDKSPGDIDFMLWVRDHKGK